MKWIGLTGGIATGKTTVADYMRQKGVKVADADRFVHQLLSRPGSAVNLILAEFGKHLLAESGGIDRKALGQIVFAEPKQLQRLEEILHPLVKAETAKTRELWKNAGEALAVYDVPLLFEKNLEKNFDQIVCVVAPVEMQRIRLRARHQLTDVEVEQRLRAQLPLAEKLARSHWVIENKGSLTELYHRVDEVLEKLKNVSTP